MATRIRQSNITQPLNADLETLGISANGNITATGDLTVGGNTAITGSLTVDGDVSFSPSSTSGTFSFGDNDKLLFGGGNDLQVFHNASHSYIDNYTGNLYFNNNTNDGTIQFATDDGTGGLTAYLLLNGSDGSVSLNHYGSQKLSTTSTGVDISGDLLVSGDFTVSGNTTFINSDNLAIEDLNIVLANGSTNSAAADGAGVTIDLGTDGSITLYWDHASQEMKLNKPLHLVGDQDLLLTASNPNTGTFFSYGQIRFGDTVSSQYLNHARIESQGGYANNADLRFHTSANNSSPLRLWINSNGDVQFYEDNGGTPQVGMHWDYTDGRLGIGTTEPNAELDLRGDMWLDGPAGTDRRIYFRNQGTVGGSIRSDKNLSLWAGNGSGSPAQYVTIEEGGNVGIGDGTISPSSMLHIYKSFATADLALQSAGASGRKHILQSKTDGSLAFYDNNASSERLRIASNGNVGIGTDSPDEQFHVSSGSTLNGGLVVDTIGDATNGDSAGIAFSENNSGGTTISGVVMGFNGGNTNTVNLFNQDWPINVNHFAIYTVESTTTKNLAISIPRASGFVGIGKDTPSERLHVGGDVMVDAGGSGNTASIKFVNDNERSRITSNYDSGGGGRLGFWTDTAGGSLLQRMTIKNDGDVGIGTPDPAYQLHVAGAGDIKIEDTSGGSAHLRIGASTSGTRDSEWKVKVSGSLDEFHIDHDYTSGGTSVGETVFKLGSNHSIYNNNNQPTIRPTLNLDFANSKELDSRITFYRDSIATYYDSKGILRYANTNTPRFDHDPATGESKGLLIEEARANQVIYSEHPEKWTYTGYGTLTGFGDYYTAPDGVSSVRSMIFDNYTSTQSRRGINTLNATSGVTYTISFYVKNINGGNNVQFYISSANLPFNGLAGASIDFSASPVSFSSSVFNNAQILDAEVKDVGNGWYRAWIVATAFTTDNWNPVFVSSTTALNPEIAVWGMQVEAGSFPTSYVPSNTRFTSRSTEATYHDENGIIRTAPANTPRYGYKYDGRKWVETGLILENAASNIQVAGTTGFTASAGTQIDSTTEIAPDGSPTAIRFSTTVPDGNRTFSVNGYIPVIANTVYTYSVYVKNVNMTGWRLSYPQSPSTGSLEILREVNTTISELSTTEWKRVEVTFKTGGSNGGIWIQDFRDGGTGSAIIWGKQLEVGYQATSFIYTGAPTTRSADVASSLAYTREIDAVYIDNMQYSDWYNREEGTYYIDLDAHTTTDTEVIVLGQAGYPWILYKYLANQWKTYNGNDSIVNPMNSLVNPFKGAISFGKTSGSSAQNGNAVLTNDANLTQGIELSNMNTLDIGYGQHATNSTFNGTIKKLSYYPTEMTSAELQALTEND